MISRFGFDSSKVYFLDSLLIATTNIATNRVPITVQIHIPPPSGPFIQLSA